MKIVLFYALIVPILCFDLLGQTSGNDKYILNPSGWALPDKKLFSLKREKIIKLESEKVIIQQIYKYKGKGAEYPYYLERFSGNCVYLDEFYRFYIDGYAVYLIRTKNTEKILLYNIATVADGGVICDDGSFATTEKEYSFSVLLADLNFDGVFDRLYFPYAETSDVVLRTKEDIEKVKDFFPYKKFFLRLLNLCDRSFMDKKQNILLSKRNHRIPEDDRSERYP